MKKVKTNWKLIDGTPNYSNELGWKAVYKRTERGFGVFTVYTDKGILYSIGGLPDFISI